MINQIVTILPFIFPIINTITPRHDYYYYNQNYYPYSRTRTQSSYKSSSTQSNDSVAGLIVAIIFFSIIGIIIYYICKRCRSHQVPPPLPTYLAQQPYPYNPPYNPNYVQQNGPINNSYPNYIYPQNIQYNSSLQNNWLGSDYSMKLKENCGFCRTFSRYGEEPRIMLSCQQRHTFHIFCINQHRAGANRHGSNTYVTNTCPICNVIVQQRVRFFCMICKEKNLEIDLRQFNDQHGVIDLTRLFQKYGEYCQRCKRM